MPGQELDILTQQWAAGEGPHVRLLQIVQVLLSLAC